MEVGLHSEGGGRNGTFQNTIDWGSVITKAISTSLDILGICSNAKVDPFTLLMGQAICDYSFELSPAGYQNMFKSLKELSYNGTFGDIIWYGFGKSTLVRDMSQFEEGIKCLALYGCLLECFQEDVAVQILEEMAKVVKTPRNRTPSPFQWQSVVRSCGGILSRTNFGQLMEKYHFVNGENDWPSPKSIAEAICGIGEVSKGKIVSITIEGGIVIGWLAALAEWLFSLRILIKHPNLQSPQKNYEDSEKAQVTFVLRIHPNTPFQVREPTQELLYCSDKIFILENVQDIMHNPLPSMTMSDLFIGYTGGRIHYNVIFAQFFGSPFELLKKNQGSVLAAAIGNAARILDAIVSAEDTIPHTLLNQWRSYCPESHGNGFIGFICGQFPELVSLRLTMEQNCSKTLDMAKSSYQAQMVLLESTCAARGCVYCAGSSESKSPLQTKWRCNVGMVETILFLGLVLCSAEVVEGLLPKRSGLEKLYSAQIGIRNKYEMACKTYPILSELQQLGFGTFPAIFWQLFETHPNGQAYNYWNSSFVPCLTLFSGYSPLKKIENDMPMYAAVSHSGMCMLSGILKNKALLEGLEEAGKFYISPGTIEHDETPYETVVGKFNYEKDKLGDLKKRLASPIEITAMAKAELHHLYVWYELRSTDRSIQNLISVHPSSFAEQLSEAQGLVGCSHFQCKESFKLEVAKDGSFNVAGTFFELIEGQNHLACAAVAFAEVGQGAAGDKVLVRGDTCLQCSVSAALRATSYYRTLNPQEDEEYLWYVV